MTGYRFGTNAWMAEAQEELARVLCPQCRRPGTLQLGRHLIAQPNASLAGTQTKVALRAEVTMACTACGLAGCLHEDSIL